MARIHTSYAVNYGQNAQHRLFPGKTFTSRKAAMHDAASAVRELGSESWAVVQKHLRSEYDLPADDSYHIIAEWRNGQRITA